MKRAETKAAKNSDDLDADHGLKIAKQESDEGVVKCTETSSVSKEALGREEKSNGVKLRQAGQSNQFEKKTNSGHNLHARPDAISSRTIQKPKSASTQADLIVKNCYKERPRVCLRGVSSLILVHLHVGTQAMYEARDLVPVPYMINREVFWPEMKCLPEKQKYVSIGRRTPGAAKLSLSR